MYKNIFDTHTHSIHSFDGNHTVMDLCKFAIDKNVLGIAITDHCDIDGVKEECWSFEDKQFADCQNAKTEYGKKLKIYTGVELGQGIYVKELAEKFLDNYKFDFVLGSIHNLENMEDFFFLDYSKYNIDELLNRYFNDVYELALWNKTDSLAHLTYPLRYIYEYGKYQFDLERFKNIIAKIFDVIIKNDKAIELNVSGLSKPMQNTLPSKDIIKLFYDMGGKYVTIGSDSHYRELVAQDIEKGMDILKECGFTHFTIFEERKPILIPIK